MPKYLKKDTIRLLEASVEAISMAVTALGLPQRNELRAPESENSIAIGLAGVAGELAMSSILVQAGGEQALHQSSGYYKTSAQIVDDFKRLILSKIPKLLFFTQHIQNPTEHIEEVLKLVSKIKILLKLRAAGLHAGKGVSRDACVVCVNDVIRLLQLLGQSSRIKPYIETLPRCIIISKSYDLIINDLINRLNQSVSENERASITASIYLVIPELPSEEPEWLQSFDRLVVSPAQNDITFLLDTLQKSKYASLIKVTNSLNSIPVTVQNGNPSALPIEIQYMKKSFLAIRDRYYADRGTANGRLEQNLFDPPPIDLIYEIFAFGFYELKIIDDKDKKLTAVDTWPLIASSLSYPGTFGPYWYFIDMTSELGQIEWYINKAADVCGKKMQLGFEEFKIGFNAYKNETPLSKSIKFVSELVRGYDKLCDNKMELLKVYNKSLKNKKTLCKEALNDLTQVVNEEMFIGEMLIKLVENKYNFENNSSQKYWGRILCEAAAELNDLPGLIAILKSPKLNSAHTAARKAIRIIDFINYGPKIE